MVIHPAQATDDPKQVTDADVVLVGVKAWQVRDAAESMKPMMRPSTFVVPLQNGVEAAAQMTEVVTPDSVPGGLCGTLAGSLVPAGEA
jgi:2-dehydropantoate 2-reductase